MDCSEIIAVCSMTFYFPFEVFIKVNPIQANIKGGGPSTLEKSRRRDENPYNNFPIL